MSPLHSYSNLPVFLLWSAGPFECIGQQGQFYCFWLYTVNIWVCDQNMNMRTYIRNSAFFSRYLHLDVLNSCSTEQGTLVADNPIFRWAIICPFDHFGRGSFWFHNRCGSSLYFFMISIWSSDSSCWWVVYSVFYGHYISVQGVFFEE